MPDFPIGWIVVNDVCGLDEYALRVNDRYPIWVKQSSKWLENIETSDSRKRMATCALWDHLRNGKSFLLLPQL